MIKAVQRKEKKNSLLLLPIDFPSNIPFPPFPLRGEAPPNSSISILFFFFNFPDGAFSISQDGKRRAPGHVPSTPRLFSSSLVPTWIHL